MKKRSRDKSSKFLKYLIYSLAIVLFYILQDMPKLIQPIFGGKPLLLIAAALVIAAFEQTVPSIVFGAVCGVLMDVSCLGKGYFAVALTLVCFAESEIFSKYFVRSFWSTMVFSLAAVSLVIFGYFLVFKAFSGIDDVWVLFLRHYIARILLTTATAAVMYAGGYLINR